MSKITFEVEIEESQAAALAQFVKRAGFSDCRTNAVDEKEAYLMIYGLGAVREGLAAAGYSPR